MTSSNTEEATNVGETRERRSRWFESESTSTEGNRMLYCFDGLRVVMHHRLGQGMLDLLIIQVLWDSSLRVVCGRGIGPADFPHPTCQR